MKEITVEEQLEKLRLEYFDKLELICRASEQHAKELAKEGIYILDGGRTEASDLWDLTLSEGNKILKENGLDQWPSNFTLHGFVDDK